MKATKKPVEIEFFTFEEIVEIGKQTNPESIHGDRAWSFKFKGHSITHENDDCYLIPTLEGSHNFTPNDVLIVGVKGEIYPCKKDIFEMTYDVISLAMQGETFEDRLRKEFKELKEKTWKLHETLYLDTQGYQKNETFKNKVGVKQWDLLNAQLNCMNGYLYILGFRLEDLGINPKEL